MASLPASDVNFKIIFEKAPGNHLVLAPDFTIVAVSDAYAHATMLSRFEMVGRNLFDVFPDNPNDPAANGVSQLRNSLNRVLEFKKPDTMAVQKYDIKRPDGSFEERHWSPLNTPIMDDRNRVVYIVHRVEDVTEYVRMKRERLEQRQVTDQLRYEKDQADKLRQSQRMEAMGQLAGGVAHDFNNILNIIMLASDSIIETEKLTAPGSHNLDQIYKSAESAATLTRQLLAFSRRQVLQPTALDINMVVSDIKTLLERVLTEDTEIVTNLSEDLNKTLIDRGQIEQVMMNLVVNARDAMPLGGKITIETANVVLDKAMSAGQMKVQPGNYVMLAVRDTGVGMDAATQARIFEPFFTTKAAGKGTGLGLSTVYGIVNQNRGTIWVYSEISKGTVFKIYFPQISEVLATESIAAKTSTHRKVDAKSKTLLVVEDQEGLRELVCHDLRASGYTVLEAENGVSALEIIRDHEGVIDLVVSDVVMPEMGGQAMAQQICRLRPKTKILFLSGYTNDVLENYMDGTAPHFLEKPFRRQALLDKVEEVLIN